MSRFFDPNDPYSFPHVPSTLPELPENVNQVPGLFYDDGNPLAASHELSSANLARWFEQDDRGLVQEPRGAPRTRRRVASSGDLIKHRRTRSGCYTCRSRRVKCDETHPVCERCMKGSRECVYPEPTSTSKAAKLGQQRKVEQEGGSSSGEYEDEEMVSPAGSQPRGESSRNRKSGASNSNLKAASRKQSRTVLSQKSVASLAGAKAKEKSLSPSTDESLASKAISDSTNMTQFSTISTRMSPDEMPWSHLPRDQQFYLTYHQQHLTHHHYFFRNNVSHFIHSTLVDCALAYDPLLYAIAGFSAFHHTVSQSNGRISDFLGYYNKSVSLLRKSLQTVQKHTDATIMTILQLAAFEEYLGDFVNLREHQKAACEMLREIYTPETICHTATRRIMMQWYARFDLLVGLIAGSEAVLEREWYYSYTDFCTEASQKEPTNVMHKIDAMIGRQLFIAVEMADLYSRLSKGTIAMPDFLEQNNKIGEIIQSARKDLESFSSYSDHFVSFDGLPKTDPDDIVNPYESGILFKEPLWAVNRLALDVDSSDMMHQLQLSQILQQLPPPHLTNIAFRQCQRFEATEYWPGSPAGALLSSSSSLGLLVLFLPRDEKHTMWCRRKLATIERMGYVWPPMFRSKLAELWSTPSVNSWWLPDEAEYPRIIRSIRELIQDRTTKPRTQANEDIRAMRAIFSKMNMDDSPKDSPESTDSWAERMDSSTGHAATGLDTISEQAGELSGGPCSDEQGFNPSSNTVPVQDFGNEQDAFARPEIVQDEYRARGLAESNQNLYHFHQNQNQGPS